MLSFLPNGELLFYGAMPLAFCYVEVAIVGIYLLCAPVLQLTYELLMLGPKRGKNLGGLTVAVLWFFLWLQPVRMDYSFLLPNLLLLYLANFFSWRWLLRRLKEDRKPHRVE